jgi:hypothetical protein
MLLVGKAAMVLVGGNDLGSTTQSISGAGIALQFVRAQLRACINQSSLIMMHLPHRQQSRKAVMLTFGAEMFPSNYQTS